MFTHLINEDAHHHLTRARRATATLSMLLISFGEYQCDGVPAEDIAYLLEYIEEDINAGLEGCEPLQSSATVEPLKAI